MKIYCYSKCSTCKKAIKYLKDHHIECEIKDIVSEVPTGEELKSYIELYNQGIKPFFNTSGKLYRELNLKDKVKDMSIDEAVELLSKNGMLIKRPLLIDGNRVFVGFKEAEYEKLEADV